MSEPATKRDVLGRFLADPNSGGVYSNAGAKTKKPYLRISKGPQAGEYVHRLVMEGMLGRELKPWEQVEHKDGDGLNDKWTNLLLTTDEEHPALTRARIRRERGLDPDDGAA
jgi:hypothetical protein